MITIPIIILKAFGFLGTKLNLMSANVFKIKNFVCVNNKEIREKLNHFCGVVDLPWKQVCAINEKIDAVIAKDVKGPVVKAQ